MPCWEFFDAQEQDYRDEVLPPACTCRVAVEAAVPFGWERYVGTTGAIIGMTGFGASAPADQLMQHFGFTAENIAAKVKGLM
jgi:transketolase